MPHTSGEWARRKLRIEFEPWQKFALGVPFGWVRKDTGFRRFTEIYIEVPRKNGKSAIAAAVGNYMFCADGEYAAEVYCGATTEKQAWKVFSPALAMVEKASGTAPEVQHQTLGEEEMTRRTAPCSRQLSVTPATVIHLPAPSSMSITNTILTRSIPR